VIVISQLISVEFEFKSNGDVLTTAKKSILCLLFMVVGSVVLDQVSKSLAEKFFLVWADDDSLRHYGGSQKQLVVFGDEQAIYGSSSKAAFYLGLNYVRNQGAAWGVLSDLKDSIRIPLFYLITILATIVILVYWRQTPSHHRFIHFALALIFSGAIGNFIDRFRLGYVIDFIDTRWSLPLPFTINLNINFFPNFLNFLNFKINTNVWRYDFPNFNWADSMISVGVMFLLVDIVFFEPKRIVKKDLVGEDNATKIT
jgi:signal peptidase II